MGKYLIFYELQGNKIQSVSLYHTSNNIKGYEYHLIISGLTSTGEQVPKTFKGSAPVVRDLSGERERDREIVLRPAFKWTEILTW